MKILALCDSPTLTTGFARVAQNLFSRWHAAGHEVDCWGIAFKGWDYRACPYVRTLFPGGGASASDNWASPGALQMFLTTLMQGDYTHVWLMQDTFNLQHYDFPNALAKACAQKGIVSCYYFPVDAPLDPAWTALILAVDLPVAYTEYGKAQALAALTPEERSACSHIHVIPHGVDQTIYQPAANRDAVRARLWQAKPDDVVLLNVNSNQWRKDVGRSLEILRAVKKFGIKAHLVMHMPENSHGPKNPQGVSLETIGAQLGLQLGQDWCHHAKAFPDGATRTPASRSCRWRNFTTRRIST